MSAAPLPSDEMERLEILGRYAILDTIAEQQYDDLTFLAAQICEAPISLLSLVDRDRQWFKSRHGIDALETPRAMSFCAHAILQTGVFEIPDTASDARFCDNDLFMGAPHIRYYAGAPLITPEGRALGTLCVIDRTPRHLSENQLRSLQALARQAVSQMELWRNIRQLEVANAERSMALGIAEETTSRLSATEKRFRQFMDNSPVMAFIKDDQGRSVYMNAPMEKTFGVSAAELRGKTDFAWLPRPVAEAVRANDAEVLQRGQTMQNIEMVPTPDGREREWLVFKFPIQEASGAQLLGGVALDMTEQRRAQRLKTDFVSVVSHELRTPLTSIRGALGLLAGGVAGEMSEKARQMIDIAQKNGDRLITLVNDILDIEKIESGKMRFELRPMSLLPWLENAIEQNRSYGAPLGVQIELEGNLEGNEGLQNACVVADESRLDQVMANLLSNACKWAPRGSVVRVKVEIAERTALIGVRDEGPGVAAEFVPHLFEKFGQADSSSTRQKGGTGLGLTIARAIVEKTGGHLDYIAPQKGEVGATFRFDLPLCAAQSEAEAEATGPLKLSPRTKILICEDDAEVAAMLSVLARQSGYQTEIAETLDVARQKISTGQFAGLSLDLLLPDGYGLDLLQELRAAGNDIPVLVVSAVSQQGKLRGEALRVLDWLDKPLDTARLLAALDGFRKPEGACLLHIEDDADVRSVVAAILGDDVRIVAATTLGEARQQLKARHFDLAILDLGLRDGNGLDLIEELNAADPPTPVILFSAREPAPDQTRLVAASLVKSRTANQELRDTIRRFLKPDCK